MKLLALVLALTLILFSNIAFASQVETHDVNINLAKDGTGHFKVLIKYSLLTTDKVYYLVFAKVLSIKGEDNKGLMECNLEKQVYGTQIMCIPNTNVTSNYTVKLEFDASELTAQIADKISFGYRYTVSDPTTLFRFGLRLPEGMGLVNATQPFSPTNATIGSTGRQVTLDWDAFLPELGKTYSFQVVYEPLFGIPISYDYLYGVLAIVVLLIIYFWRIRKPSAAERAQTILSVLNEQEKRVLEVIMEKDGIKQRDIVKATAFSKAKVSRIIADLEKRGILKKEPIGRTNKIFVADKRLKKTKLS